MTFQKHLRITTVGKSGKVTFEIYIHSRQLFRLPAFSILTNYKYKLSHLKEILESEINILNTLIGSAQSSTPIHNCSYCFLISRCHNPNTAAPEDVPQSHSINFTLHGVKCWLVPFRFAIEDRDLRPPDVNCFSDLPRHAVTCRAGNLGDVSAWSIVMLLKLVLMHK